MNRPHVILAGVTVFHADILATGEFQQGGMTKLGGSVDAAHNRGIADDLALSGDTDVLRIHGRDEADKSLDPAAFPANLGERIVSQIGRSQNRRARIEAQKGVGAKHDCTGKILARGNQDLSPSEHAATVQCLLDCGCIFCLAIAPMRRSRAH